MAKQYAALTQQLKIPAVQYALAFLASLASYGLVSLIGGLVTTIIPFYNMLPAPPSEAASPLAGLPAILLFNFVVTLVPAFLFGLSFWAYSWAFRRGAVKDLKAPGILNGSIVAGVLYMLLILAGTFIDIAATLAASDQQLVSALYLVLFGLLFVVSWWVLLTAPAKRTASARRKPRKSR